MKIDNIKQPSFKAVYIKDDRFNSREKELANYISGRLLGSRKSGDEKARTWNEWLKEEKGIDVFVKRAKDTQDMLTVFGLKNVKDFDNKLEGKDFFLVGNYHTRDFEPEHVLNAHKEDKQFNGCAIGTLVLLGLGCIGAFLYHVSSLKNYRVNKEIPAKVIQMKDSIADSLKITKIGKNIIK